MKWTVGEGPIPEVGDDNWWSVDRKHFVHVYRVWLCAGDTEHSVAVSWDNGKRGTALPMSLFLKNYLPDEPAKRPTKHDYFMQLAQSAAERSTCPRLKVGCVVVRDEVVFGQGYNGKARGERHCVHQANVPCVDSVHAEVNLIASAARLGNKIGGAHLYVTHAPCLSCARAIINAGLSAVTYGNAYRDSAGVELLQERGMIV